MAQPISSITEGKVVFLSRSGIAGVVTRIEDMGVYVNAWLDRSPLGYENFSFGDLRVRLNDDGTASIGGWNAGEWEVVEDDVDSMTDLGYRILVAERNAR